MNRKQRAILLLVVFWSVVLDAAGVGFWRADRQERLNRQLIAAIDTADTSAVLPVLQQGSDAQEANRGEGCRLQNDVRGG